jgi:hypothetical protein
MEMKRVQSIFLHLAVTLLLTCGFVKTAGKFDPLQPNAVDVDKVVGHPPLLGGLPCGSNKD